MDDFDDLLPTARAFHTPGLPDASMASSTYPDESFEANPFADLQSSRYVGDGEDANAEERVDGQSFRAESPVTSTAASSPTTERRRSIPSSPSSPTTTNEWSRREAPRPLQLSPSLSVRTPAYDAIVSPIESFDGRQSVQRDYGTLENTPGGQTFQKETEDANKAEFPQSPEQLQLPRKDNDNVSVHTTSGSVRTVPLSSKASSSNVSLESTLTEHGNAANFVKNGENPTEIDHGRPQMLITVSDPQKVGSEIIASAHTVYTVRSVSSRRPTPRSVLRRFKDFLWLYDTLCNNNAGCVVPPPPEKHALGRFGGSFVEVRRKGLQVFLGKVAAHPMLWSDPDFKMFLESDTFAIDIRHRAAPPTPATPSFFVPALLSGQPRFVEDDEFFDHRQAQLSALEPSLRSLSQTLLAVTKSRSGLVASITDLATAVAALEACDLSNHAKKTLAALEELTSRVQALEQIVVLGGESTLASMVDAWLRLSTTSVKHAFNARSRAWTAWQKQISTVKSMKSALEKKKSQNIVPAAMVSEIIEAERKTELLKHEYDDVTKLVKSEMLRFDFEKVDDFRLGLAEYVDGLVKKQEEIVTAYERYWTIVEQMHQANAALRKVASPRIQT